MAASVNNQYQNDNPRAPSLSEAVNVVAKVDYS